MTPSPRFGFRISNLFRFSYFGFRVFPLLPLASCTPTQPPTPPQHPTDYKSWPLAFHDEFTGTSLDPAKWHIGLPWRGTDGEGRHHNDLYASYIMDHNVQVSGGALHLLTRRETVTAKNGRPFEFTQGLVTSAKTFRHTYGYWEARVKLPASAGPGLWPAFWTLADGWPPEMDICEVWTSDNRSHQGLCFRPEGARRGEKWDEYNAHTPLPTGWTTYGMEWGPGYQIYNVNGAVMHRAYGDHVPADKHYILLNSGVAADKRPTPATTFPNSFDVDYVRVYARPDLPALHNPSFEYDDPRPWNTTGNAAVVAHDPHSGNHALRLHGPATAQQKLHGLRPNTTYTLTAHAKSLTPAAKLQLAIAGPEKQNEPTRHSGTASPAYHPLTLTFTTGPDTTTATLTLTLPDPSAAALIDSLTLRPTP